MIQRWIRLARYERLFSLDPPNTLSTDLLFQLDHFRATRLQRRLQRHRRLQSLSEKALVHQLKVQLPGTLPVEGISVHSLVGMCREDLLGGLGCGEETRDG